MRTEEEVRDALSHLVYNDGGDAGFEEGQSYQKLCPWCIMIMTLHWVLGKELPEQPAGIPDFYLEALPDLVAEQTLETS